MKTQMCDGICTSKFIFIRKITLLTLTLRPKDVAEIMPFPGRKLGENISMVQPSPAAVGFYGTHDKSITLNPGEPVLLFLHHGHKDLFLRNSEDKMPVPVLVLPKTSDLTSQKSNHFFLTNEYCEYGYFQPQPPYPLCRFATV